MKFLKLAVPMLAVLCFASALKAEDAPGTEAPKTTEPKPAETPKATEPAKPADNGELPNAPAGTATLSPIGASETLTGDISKVDAPEKGKAKKKAKKAGTETSSLVLAVTKTKEKGVKKEKGAAKTPKTITLTASGDIFTKLTELAEKHAHIKVTGTLNGDSMTVKEVAEAPADEGKAKKKKKNDA